MTFVRVWRARDPKARGIHYIGRDRFHALGPGRHPYWRVLRWYVAIRWPDHAADRIEEWATCYVCEARQARHERYPKCRYCGEPNGLLTAVEMLTAASSENENG